MRHKRARTSKNPLGAALLAASVMATLVPSQAASADDSEPSLTPLVHVDGSIESSGLTLLSPPAFSGSGEWVVYLEGPAGSTSIVRLHVPSGRSNKITGPGNYREPAISDAGRVVSYTSASNGSTSQIYRWTASSGQSELISEGTGQHATHSSISDTGDRVAWLENPISGQAAPGQVAVWALDEDIQYRPGGTVVALSGNGRYVFYQDVNLADNWRWDLTDNTKKSVYILGNVSDNGNLIVGNEVVGTDPGVIFYWVGVDAAMDISMPSNTGVMPPVPAVSGDGLLASIYTKQDLIVDNDRHGWATYALSMEGPETVLLPLREHHRVIGWSDDGQTALVYEVSRTGSYNLELLDMSPELQPTPSEGERPAADQILRLYQAIFGRSPDATGAAYWKDLYQSGRPLIAIADDFRSTIEFKTRYGSNPTDQELIDGLYQNVFNRTPDAAGRNYWLGRLTEGTSRPELIVVFSDSDENISQTGTSRPLDATGSSIVRVYQAALGRFPDPGGYRYWVNRRKRGTTLEALAAVMLNSPEGEAKYGPDLDDESLIGAMYTNVLDRPADEVGLTYWTERRAAGLSAEQLIVAFANSIENIRRTGTAP